jgi:hypothetical protein
VPNSLSSDTLLLVKKLEMWTSELALMDREQEHLACSLADMGVLVRSAPPRIGPRDGRSVVRLKEQLTALHRRREALIDELAAVGASILDAATLEVILPGGPEEGSFLSWQPGEPHIAWWRSEAAVDSRRLPLPEAAARPGPALH